MTFDEKRLAALREKYGADKAGEIFDPKFAKVGEKIFSNGTRAAPYAGVPTFVSAPYRQVDQRNPDVSDLDVAIVGVPMDLASPTVRIALRAPSSAGDRSHRSLQPCSRMRAGL